MKKTTIVILIVLVVAAAALLTVRFFFGGDEDTWLCQDGQWVKHGNPSAPAPTTGCGNATTNITSFEDCQKAGYPILESYPEQCKTPDGQTFTQDIGNVLEKKDLIQIANPQPQQKITSPLTITGQARGNWFFEASFPVKLVDQNGDTLAEAIAQAQTEWMTENFVAFKATLEFPKPTTATGVLILQKDNPSGLPENDDWLVLPVKF